MQDSPQQRASNEDEPSLLRQAFNVPNLLSILRLAGVPLFLWLLLGPHADGWALAVLVFSAVTDWLDGKLARWLNQMSRLGQLLDPAADRLYVVVTLVAFLVREIVPWWVVVALIGRELVVGVCLMLLRHEGFALPEVSYVGKAATFNLMYAFPLLLLTDGNWAGVDVLRPLAYAFTIWGGALYLWSGMLYVLQTKRAVSAVEAGGPATQGERDWHTVGPPSPAHPGDPAHSGDTEGTDDRESG